MDPIRIHQQYLLSIPNSYELLRKWHPMIHHDSVDHSLDFQINSLILNSPWIEPPNYVYWLPEEEFDCNRNFNLIRSNAILSVYYPILTTLEPRSDNDSLIKLSPNTKVMYFPENTVLIPIQNYKVLETSWTGGNLNVKALFLEAY